VVCVVCAAFRIKNYIYIDLKTIFLEKRAF